MATFLAGVRGGDGHIDSIADAVRARTDDPVHVYRDGRVALLSSRPGIDQGALKVAFNGHLLHRGEEETAEERIVSLYEQHGADFPAAIDGRFRAAVYDTDTDRLVLASDKIGSKFIYYEPGEPFTFSSYLSPLLAVNGGATLDREAAAQHAMSTMQLFGGGPTLVDGVRKTYSSERVLVSGRTVDRDTYWDVPRTGTRQVSDDTAVERIEDLLADAIDRSCARHDGPIPVMFSGGLDSSVLVSLLRERAPDRDIHTYTFSWSDTGLERAAEMAERLGAEPHTFRREYRLPDRDDIWLYEEPATIPDLPTRQLNRSKGVDGLFTGFPAVIPFPVSFDRVRRLDRMRSMRSVARTVNRPAVMRRIPDRFAGLGSAVDTLASPHMSTVMTNAMQVPVGRAREVLSPQAGDVEVPEARIDRQWELDGGSFERTFHYLHLRMYDGPFTGLMFNDTDNHEVYGYPPLIEYVFSLPRRQIRDRRLLKRVARGRVPDRLVSGGPSGIGFVTDNILLPSLRQDRERYEDAVGRLADRDLFDAAALNDMLVPDAYEDLSVGRVLYMQRMYELERWLETFIDRDSPWERP